MATPLQHTASAEHAIARVKYSHDAMIDLILQNPGVHQNKLAEHFGYSAAWVSRVVNSSAFQARLAERKTEVVDPTIIMNLEEKFEILAHQSLDILTEKLATVKNPDLAMKALDLSAKALGFGARQQNVNLQQNFVVAMPSKVPDAHAWAERHTGIRAIPDPRGVVEEAVVLTPGTPSENPESSSPDLARLLDGV